MNEPDHTEVSLRGYGFRSKVMGPAWAVIIIIALLGMIWIASKSIDLAARVAVPPIPGVDTDRAPPNQREG